VRVRGTEAILAAAAATADAVRRSSYEILARYATTIADGGATPLVADAGGLVPPPTPGAVQ
jgi:hypothetical protein